MDQPLVVRSSAPGPKPAPCPPARLRRRPPQLLPAVATGSKSRDARVHAQLEAELAAVEGETHECTVRFFGQGLLSLCLVGETAGIPLHREVRVCTLDLCTAQPLLMAEELDPRRRTAFQAEATRRLHHLLETFIQEQGDLDEAESADLRAQPFELDSEQLELAQGQAVFPTRIRTQSRFVNQFFAGGVGPAFSFAELQPYLRPESPLRRLVQPPARPTPGRPPRTGN
ncbi:hypothetical protein [Hymenobacter arizonensis]|uniref:hypothetical protein n=1 Tax=Hymenobacter arizonensis TaxID=1227077 RepID=UPI0011603866|nr:hypothetical protein [Hymenobacter arizonensis]